MLPVRRAPAFYLLLATLAASAVSADPGQEHRRHAAHVHGIGKLNLVLEGREIHVELESPAANVVGFEHAPSSATERAVLNRAISSLKNGDRRLRFTAAAQCRMTSVDIASGLLETDQLDHQDQNGTHGDISAHYRFECDKPERLKTIEVDLFDIFPATERLDVQYIMGGRQNSATLTGKQPRMAF